MTITTVLVVVASLACSAALALGVIEVTLRRWVRERHDEGLSDRATFTKHGRFGLGSWTLSAEDAAMRDSGFSPTHWAEMKKYLEMKPKLGFSQVSSKDTRLVYSLRGYDFGGLEFSVKDGRRTTTDQPAEARNQILCVGGSTTFCLEMSDQNTWPSKLQRRVNHMGSSHIVHNLGIPGAPGLDRIAFLRNQIQLKQGDIAVFLFGDNDSGYIQWQPKLGRVQDGFPRLAKRILNKLEYEYSRGVLVAGWLQREITLPYLRRAAKATAMQTQTVAEELMTWASSCGATVIFVLQPNLMTLKTPDHWDRQVLASTAQDLFPMLEVAYRMYRVWITENSNVVSASHIFDGEKPSPYMGDWSHVNTRGNELIADFVFRELGNRELLERSDDSERVD